MKKTNLKLPNPKKFSQGSLFKGYKAIIIQGHDNNGQYKAYINNPTPGDIRRILVNGKGNFVFYGTEDTLMDEFMKKVNWIISFKKFKNNNFIKTIPGNNEELKSDSFITRLKSMILKSVKFY